jgi:hypothetical protein
LNDAELRGIVDPDAAALNVYDALPAQVAEDARRGLLVYDAGRSASTPDRFLQESGAKKPQCTIPAPANWRISFR